MGSGNDRVKPESYDRTYFESGLVTGVSGYMNYSWLPELTLRMAHKLILGLPIERDQCVLDLGCAKGFLVKALRVLDVEAYGADVSAYAISQAPSEVRDHCTLIGGCDDSKLFERTYDWMVCKDVLEHLVEADLRLLLKRSHDHVGSIFGAIPLAADDECGTYIVPEYDRDVTHVTAKSLAWWKQLFESEGWRIELASHSFDGCKENWTEQWPEGNAFIVASSAAGSR
ncbi:MAG: methyltransferase domain-containing protein [Myxococcales bacterium]|nr:methyltransferase domain-containing protein [Myxococcales bacterium]